MKRFLNDFKSLKLYKMIEKQIENKVFSHSHIFLCEDDFSAKVFSFLVAQTLLCENKNACGKCGSCKKVLAGTHPDLIVLPKEKTFMVADASKVIENAYSKPINSENKVFLLNDFHLANIASQNKILKILEEPNSNVFFIINATNEKKILQTVLSRAQKHFVQFFEKDKLKEILNFNKIEFSQSAISLSGGYLGKALAFSENKDFFNNYEFVLNVLQNMKTSKDIIKFSAQMSERSSFVLKLEIFENFFRNILLYNNTYDEKLLLSETEKLTILPFAKEFSTSSVLSILDRLTKAKMFYDSNVSLFVVADNLLLGILEDKFLFK